VSNGFQGRKVVVVSPHSDDGVLSLGAAMAWWARAGARVELLTVFALDPASNAPTGGWDGRAGFRTEGEAAQARRAEDRAASAILGATASWLPFGSVDYERHGDEAAVRDAVIEKLRGADLLLLPGHPLTHPDHVWLARALDGSRLEQRVGRYAEQPYASRSGSPPGGFERLETGARTLFAKWRAIRRYRSQRPLLALGPLTLLRDERVAWDDL
jgi:LmbE family N-acetylglucosaminyl deacetylase